jgi:hypothetical protein
MDLRELSHLWSHAAISSLVRNLLSIKHVGPDVSKMSKAVIWQNTLVHGF